MASQVDLISHAVTASRPDRVRSAYFRASLTELCRVEDLAKVVGKKFSFRESSDPSLHLVKLLRNYQVHIASSSLGSGSVAVLLSGEQMVYKSFVVDNVTSEELCRLDSAKGYSVSQLAKLVDLFEASQRKFGVVQLLYHLAKRVEERAKSVLTTASEHRESRVCALIGPPKPQK